MQCDIAIRASPGRIGVLACALAATKPPARDTTLRRTGEDAYTPRRSAPFNRSTSPIYARTIRNNQFPLAIYVPKRETRAISFLLASK
jgi:hypothetical protein